MKRPMEYVDTNKWTEEYDKALPAVILNQCTLTDCGLCSVPLNGPAVAKSHYEGKNHEKRVQLALADLYPDPETAPKRMRIDDGAPEVVKAPRRAAVKVEDGTDDEETNFYCEICNLPCTSRIVFDSHMAGKSHASR